MGPLPDAGGAPAPSGSGDDAVARTFSPSEQAMSPVSESALRTRLRQTFDTFDSDGSGEVSMDEFAQMMGTLGVALEPEKLQQIMMEADADQNGGAKLMRNC